MKARSSTAAFAKNNSGSRNCPYSINVVQNDRNLAQESWVGPCPEASSFVNFAYLEKC